MDDKEQVRDFLRSRRDRLTPQDVGLIGGGRRRVPGLRREDVAALAGISIDYYARIERGNLSGVSPEVLDSLAKALRLDEAETEHLRDLARAAGPGAHRQAGARVARPTLRPSLQRLLEAINTPAWVSDPRADILATNHLGRAVLAPMLDDPANQQNLARFIFLSPASRIYYPDWELGADSAVSALRFAAGRDPHDKGLTDLIGELVTRSDAFRSRWAAHDVRLHRTGLKRVNHPSVGLMEFTYEGLELPDSPGWVLYAYTVAAGSTSEDALKLLGSLAAPAAQLCQD